MATGIEHGHINLDGKPLPAKIEEASNTTIVNVGSGFTYGYVFPSEGLVEIKITVDNKAYMLLLEAKPTPFVRGETSMTDLISQLGHRHCSHFFLSRYKPYRLKV